MKRFFNEQKLSSTILLDLFSIFPDTLHSMFVWTSEIQIIVYKHSQIGYE